MKSVRIWSFSGLYFLAFGLNTERYGVYGHFSRSVILCEKFLGVKFDNKLAFDHNVKSSGKKAMAKLEVLAIS